MRRYLLPVLIAALVAALSWPAQAHHGAQCAPRDAMLRELATRYVEAPAAIGIGAGNLVELLTAPDGLTWTIIWTTPAGRSCIMASGEGWRMLEPSVPDEPS